MHPRVLFLATACCFAVTQPASTTWCESRLKTLREHVAARRFGEAYDMSTSLDHSSPSSLPAACLADSPYQGLADVLVLADGPWVGPHLRLRDPGGDPEVMPIHASDEWALLTTSAIKVTGFTLDGNFVMLSHGAISNGQRARGTRGAGDYTLGEKEILIIPAVPEDQCGDDGAAVFAGGLVDTYGGIINYLQAAVEFANTFFDEASWGSFRLKPTIVAPVCVAGFTYAGCGSFGDRALGWNSYDPVSDALDTLAIAACEDQRGLSPLDFLFYGVVIPGCEGIAWSGLGWVGSPGFVINLNANSLDPSLLHELGHNIGLNHGARLTSQNRGRVLAETTFVDAWASTRPLGYQEYGSLVTLMGKGETPSAQPMLPGKLMMEWASRDAVVRVEQPDGCGVSGETCGPYYLQPTDSGTFDSGAFVGVRIASEIADRYFWVEHRTLSAVVGDRPAIVVCSASYSSSAESLGGGGITGITILADAATEGDSSAPQVHEMEELQLDASVDGSGLPLWVRVGAADSRGYLPVTIAATAPGPSPPTPPAPPGIFQGCDDHCCNTVILDNIEYTLYTSAPCCYGKCAYQTVLPGSKVYYLQYVADDWDEYIVVDSLYSTSCFHQNTVASHVVSFFTNEEVADAASIEACA